MNPVVSYVDANFYLRKRKICQAVKPPGYEIVHCPKTRTSGGNCSTIPLKRCKKCFNFKGIEDGYVICLTDRRWNGK